MRKMAVLIILGLLATAILCGYWLWPRFTSTWHNSRICGSAAEALWIAPRVISAPDPYLRDELACVELPSGTFGLWDAPTHSTHHEGATEIATVSAEYLFPPALRVVSDVEPRTAVAVDVDSNAGGSSRVAQQIARAVQAGGYVSWEVEKHIIEVMPKESWEVLWMPLEARGEYLGRLEAKAQLRSATLGFVIVEAKHASLAGQIGVEDGREVVDARIWVHKTGIVQPVLIAPTNGVPVDSLLQALVTECDGATYNNPVHIPKP